MCFLFQALPRIGSRLSLLIIQCFSAVSAAAVSGPGLKTTLTAWQIVACLTILAGVATALAPGKHLNATRKVLCGWSNLRFAGRLWQRMGPGSPQGLRGGEGRASKYRRRHRRLPAPDWRLAGGRDLSARRPPARGRRTIHGRARRPAARGGKMAAVLAVDFWPIVCRADLGRDLLPMALKTTPTGLVLAIVATTPLVVIPFASVLEGEKIEAHPSPEDCWRCGSRSSWFRALSYIHGRDKRFSTRQAQNIREAAENGEEYETQDPSPGAAFREDARDMRHVIRTKNRAAGYYVGFHGNRFLRRPCFARGCPPDEPDSTTLN